MLRFAVIGLLLVVALCIAKPTKEEAVEKARKINEECKKTSGLDQEAFYKALVDGSTDDKVKEHALCFFEKIGVIGEDGNVDMEKIKKHFEEHLPDISDELTAKCLTEKDNAKATTYTISKCTAEFFQKLDD